MPFIILYVMLDAGKQYFTSSTAVLQILLPAGCWLGEKFDLRIYGYKYEENVFDVSVLPAFCCSSLEKVFLIFVNLARSHRWWGRQRVRDRRKPWNHTTRSPT